MRKERNSSKGQLGAGQLQTFQRRLGYCFREAVQTSVCSTDGGRGHHSARQEEQKGAQNGESAAVCSQEPSSSL